MTSRLTERGSGDQQDSAEVYDPLRRTPEQRARVDRLMVLGTFALGIAHELANPIGSLQIAARHALETSEGARRDELLLAIIKDSQRCCSVIDALSRFMSEGVLPKQLVSVRAIVSRCEDRIREEGHALAIELKVDSAVQSIPCHATAMEQALSDLFRNSVQAANGSCHIELTASRRGDSIQIICQDDGPGIPESALEQVFEPFYTTTRARGGMGLGLTIARDIVAAHGGKLHAVASPAGARFVMELPAS